MAVKIRMTRMGRRHRPFFRINAIESRNSRDGRILEKLGQYDPILKDKEKQIILNVERIQYWLDKGAVPSDTVSEMLVKAGIKHKYAEQKAARMTKARELARKKGVPFNEAERIAIKKAAEQAEAKVKAEAEEAEAAVKAKAKAEADAKAQAEADVEAKAEVEAALEVEEAEAKAAPEADVKAAAEVEAAPEVEKAEAETKAKEAIEAKAAKAEAKAADEAEVKTETEEAKAEAAPETKSAE
jgi:small subunit ribosomal protein S16